jgi:hypothetical protein
MGFLDDLPSFDHLAPAKTERCTVHGVTVHSDKPLTLIVRCANEENAGWTNAVRKISGRFVGIEPTARQSFDAYLQAFAEHVVVGWEDANNKAGQPETYAPEKLVGLLKRVADRNLEVASSPIFWARNQANFRSVALPNAEELGKP